ncbi:response regulator transcription factor [Microbacterium rhizophilus]|uniref:response regulator transcription factor n=1 Tax=Microbacterium rhizophilus TaxID=3138934 RepID=UPI0031EAFC18
MTPVRLLVVEDHAVFREGIKALLAQVPEIEVVGEAADTEAAVAAAAALRPDIALVDLGIPGEGGASVIARLAAEGTATAAIVLTMYSDGLHVRQALRAGARGFLSKDAPPESIIHAILAVADGQFVLDAGAAQIALSHADSGRSRVFPALTDREHEVLERMARGLGNQAVAELLGVSVKTVQNSVSSIFLKLGARDRAHAISLARDAGLGASAPGS